MSELETCSLCPRLCRHACPVAVGTGREAATPTAIAGVLVDHARGQASDELARQAATLCVDCGACQDACHLHQPLPSLLRQARDVLLSPSPGPALPSVPSGVQSVWLVVESADTTLPSAEAPSDVHIVVCPERLGVDHDFGASPELDGVRAAFTGYDVYTMDGGIFDVLHRAGLEPRWALKVSAMSIGSCVCTLGERPPLACCGGRGPLREYHPASAKQLAWSFARRLEPGRVLLDTRCAQHLRAQGCAVDPHAVIETGEMV
jgi:hypothetical protein